MRLVRAWRTRTPAFLIACLVLLLNSCLKPSEKEPDPPTSETPPTDTVPLPLLVDRGAKLYSENCASCHGVNGEGGVAGQLNDQSACLSCGSLESLSEKISSSMPPNNPQICGKDCAEAITAFMSLEFFSDKSRCDDSSRDLGQRALRMLTNREYLHTVRDLFQLGYDFVPATFPPETRVLGFSTNHSQAVATERKMEDWLAAAHNVVNTADLPAVVACDIHQNPRCFLDTFALKVFRRPLTLEEKSAYGKLAAEDGVAMALKAMLISPNFLYRSEIGTETTDGVYQLDSYEVATALSYMFLETTPDAQLLALAASGELLRPEVIKSQAARLMTLPEAKRMTAQFAVEWLQVDKISQSKADPSILSSSLKEDMLNETKAFFNHVAFHEKGLGFADLFSSDVTMINSRLAGYYGLNHPGSDRYEIISLRDDRRGLLGHGSVLVSTSYPDQTSPIRRGLFVRDRILCQKLPDPPPDADVNVPPPNPSLSTRERFARHNADPSCRDCHKLIDAIGFGMESFDEFGRFRAIENGKPIDTAGVLINLENLGANPSVEYAFTGSAELSHLIAESPKAKQCFALQFYRFSRGVSANASEVCGVNKTSARFADGKQSIQDLMIEMTQTSSFLFRR
ncbi:MAG: DUF1592 domain-containing protein [Pseudobacteriovorax sp.]|nr:DUF1592 domain-containing protein [Pseudobacteriovorax sp.]